MVNPASHANRFACVFKAPPDAGRGQGGGLRRSMTALAAGEGAAPGWTWSLELRSVNGKGRDLRMRLPDWLTGLEAAMRAALTQRIARGSVTCSLRLSRVVSDGEGLDSARLDGLLDSLQAVETAAARAGVSLRPTSAAEILAMRPQGAEAAPLTAEEQAALLAAIIDSLPPILSAFEDMRQAEGAALAQVLTVQLSEIAALVTRAEEAIAARAPQMEANFRAALARVADQLGEVEEGRVAQELALLAVKADVTEEIDRLRTHLDAANALLGAEGAVGRKLDFLCQELNREANTLCAKSQDAALTQIGLDLKHSIDQFREQVQNLE